MCFSVCMFCPLRLFALFLSEKKNIRLGVGREVERSGKSWGGENILYGKVFKPIKTQTKSLKKFLKGSPQLNMTILLFLFGFLFCSVFFFLETQSFPITQAG